MLSLGWVALAFRHSCARSCLGELGDKTFLLTAVFAAWGPWEGVRKSDDRFLQLCLVLGGAFPALALHATLLLTVVGPNTSTNYTWYCEVLSSVSLMSCGLKAMHDLSLADASKRRSVAKPAASGNPFKADVEEDPQPKVGNKWNEHAFRVLDGAKVSEEPEEAAHYGSFTPPAASADGLFSNRIGDKTVSRIFAFLGTLVVVFLAETEDKSQDAYGVNPTEADGGAAFVVGSVLGLLIATAVAVFIGYLLERQFSDTRILFFVTSVFAGLGLVSISQTLLHTSWASPVSPVRQALLAIVTRVRSEAGM